MNPQILRTEWLTETETAQTRFGGIARQEIIWHTERGSDDGDSVVIDFKVTRRQISLHDLVAADEGSTIDRLVVRRLVRMNARFKIGNYVIEKRGTNVVLQRDANVAGSAGLE